jgi:transposase-like protein
MVLPGRMPLQGVVEVDETILGGPESGTWGTRLGQQKSLVAIAAEQAGTGIGRIRLARLSQRTRQQLHRFIQQSIAPGSEVCTDGLPAYRGLERLGYRHQPVSLIHRGKDAPTQELPRVHRIAALLKRWLLGTHHGGVGPEHLDYYLDEFTFRFNRRKARTPGKLFHALLHQAVREEPAPYHTLIRPSP